MNDEELVAQISALVAEEHQLEESHVGEGLSTQEKDRLRSIEIMLDQLWDTLRQRRAKRDYGRDPDDVQQRSAETVEGYLQ